MSKAQDIADKKIKILAYFTGLPVYKYAAHSVGIDEKTLERWRKDDPGFDGQLKQAASTYFARTAGKARAEFRLERLDRDVWKPPTQEHELGENIIEALLEGYGLGKKNEGNDDGQDDGAVHGPSKIQT